MLGDTPSETSNAALLQMFDGGPNCAARDFGEEVNGVVGSASTPPWSGPSCPASAALKVARLTLDTSAPGDE